MRADTPDPPPGPAEPGYDYDAIYREYAPKVRALARRKLLGRDVHEDVVQEVFIRAFRALPTLDLERPLWPWLHRVCVNVCNDILKSPRTWAEEPVDELPDDVAAAEVDPVALVVAEEQRQAIADALDMLAPRQREILLRRVLEDASTEMMADADGTSVDAVKSAVKRGRQMFRRAYTDIASERGLLGGQPVPALPDRVRAAFERFRGAYEACLRLCNSPGWQAVPVAVSAAVLMLGWGVGPGGGPDAAGADDVPWGRDSYQGSLAVEATVSAAARTSSGATRPGGGAPPSSPPGRDRGNDDKPKRPITSGRVGAGLKDEGDDSTLYIRWDRAHEPLSEHKGFTFVSYEVGCFAGAVRRAACDAIKGNSPEVTRDYVYWGD